MRHDYLGKIPDLPRRHVYRVLKLLDAPKWMSEELYFVDGETATAIISNVQHDDPYICCFNLEAIIPLLPFAIATRELYALRRENHNTMVRISELWQNRLWYHEGAIQHKRGKKPLTNAMHAELEANRVYHMDQMEAERLPIMTAYVPRLRAALLACFESTPKEG